MKTLRTVALTASALAFSTWAGAVPVSWHVDDTVQTGNLGDFFFPFVAHAGDLISFDFTFERNTPCSFCEGTSQTYHNALTAWSYTFDGQTYVLPVTQSDLILDHGSPNTLGTFNDGLNLSVLSLTDAEHPAFFGDFFVGVATSTPDGGFTNPLLTKWVPPGPGAFGAGGFFDMGASEDRGFDSFGGSFLEPHAVTIPEPSTLPLTTVAATMGLVVLGLRRRRTIR